MDKKGQTSNKENCSELQKNQADRGDLDYYNVNAQNQNYN